MSDTRDLSNKRITIGVGPLASVADPSAPTETEARGLLHLSPAVRWSGLAFGAQASQKIDDRSLDDDAAASLRGFPSFGGAVPLFWPKVIDTSSILRQAFNLLKDQGTDLIWVERVGFASTSEEFAAGDNVNTYVVTTDGFNPDTSGNGGYAYILEMLARGITYPWTILGTTVPTVVTVAGPAALAVGAVGLATATYLGNDITKRATWRSADETVAVVHNGVVVGVGAGTANIYADFHGATESTALAITVS